MDSQSTVTISKNATPEAAAGIIGVDVETLNKWRCLRKGPPFVRISARCIRYPVDQLERWIQDRVVTPVGN